MKQNQICLSEQDYQSLFTLMDSGISFQHSLNILERPNNTVVFDSIRKHLEIGELAENFFIQFAPKKYRYYLSIFLSFVPMLESMSLTMEICSKQEKAKKQLKKGIVYPLGLLVGTCIGIEVFNSTVLPNMLNLMDSFKVTDSSMYITQYLIGILCHFVISVLCILFVSIYVGTRKKHIVSTYIFISKYFPNGLFVQYASNQFAMIFEECVKKNISTKMSISMLKQMRDFPLIAYIADVLERQCLQGDSFTQAISSIPIEQALVRFFTVAMYSSKVEVMLQGYIDMCQKRIKIQIQRFTHVVQSIAYGVIGIVIVFVYQILMLPMNVLQMM